MNECPAQDFDKALDEIKPAFGASMETLQSYAVHGIIPCGENFDHLLQTMRTLVSQVRGSDKTPLLSVTLEGPAGSGKSALAASVAIESDFPFVKVISSESMVGYSEQVRTCSLPSFVHHPEPAVLPVRTPLPAGRNCLLS